MSDFKAKMHKIWFPLEFHPRTHWGELTALHQAPKYFGLELPPSLIQPVS